MSLSEAALVVCRLTLFNDKLFDIVHFNQCTITIGTFLPEIEGCKLLTVKVRYGRNLLDADGWWNDSDPYVEIVAVDDSGIGHRRTTRVEQGTHNPNWHQTLHFGRSNWRHFRIRVWDSDNNADDALSNLQTIYVRPGTHYSQKHCAYYSCNSNIIYDYTLN